MTTPPPSAFAWAIALLIACVSLAFASPTAPKSLMLYCRVSLNFGCGILGGRKGLSAAACTAVAGLAALVASSALAAPWIIPTATKTAAASVRYEDFITESPTQTGPVHRLNHAAPADGQWRNRAPLSCPPRSKSLTIEWDFC